MKTIIDEEISKLNNLMEGKSIHIDNVISDTTICQCDKKLITKAIHSIIKNSIIYNKDKGNIIISEKKDLAYTILSIHDTGIGIADDHKEKIFEKFFRVDSSLNYEIGGVGVGLYLAKKIVELHNGKVNVRSEFGKGTEFSILLPLKNKISND
jgi:signal transduction histidine kinase